MIDEEKAIVFLTEVKSSCSTLIDKELWDICDISIKALEKQIPKEPSWKKYTSEKRCPICNEMTALRNEYCIFCGQALNWSDV